MLVVSMLVWSGRTNQSADRSVEKMMTKMKLHGDDIEIAIRALGDRIHDFQMEVDLCSQMRFARMEGQLVRLVTYTKEVGDRFNRLLHGELQTPEQLQQAAFYNQLYKFFGSSPMFNARDGTSKSLVQRFTNRSDK